MELKEMLKADITFRSQMLWRMIADCKYYLGYGMFSKHRLWTHDEKKQIQYMRALYISLKRDNVQNIECEELINNYGRMMVLTKDQHVAGLETALKQAIEKKCECSVTCKYWTVTLEKGNVYIKYKNEIVMKHDGWIVTEEKEFYSFPKAYRVIKRAIFTEGFKLK